MATAFKLLQLTPGQFGCQYAALRVKNEETGDAVWIAPNVDSKARLLSGGVASQRVWTIAEAMSLVPGRTMVGVIAGLGCPALSPAHR